MEQKGSKGILTAWVVYEGEVHEAKAYKIEGDVWPPSDITAEALEAARATLKSRLWWVGIGTGTVFLYCHPEDLYYTKASAYFQLLTELEETIATLMEAYDDTLEEHKRLVNDDST